MPNETEINRTEADGVRSPPGKAPRTLPPPGAFGPYEVLGELGHGGMGTVYRVRHTSLGTEYAVKSIQAEALDENVRARFLREMEILGSLRHAHIVGVHSSGRTAKGDPFYVMELVEGTTLAQKLKKQGSLPVHEAASILAKAARAAAFAHERGVIHRDLKPENVLVRAADGEVKLVDFGLARGDRKEFGSLTKEGEIMGTPAFMSPEQVDGTKETTPATDIWSLGILLFHLTTGELPYPQGQGTLATLQAIASRDPRLPSSVDSELPEAVDEVFLRCCAHDPEDRYPDAIALAEDLEELARSEAPRDDAVLRARARAFWKHVALGALALAGVGLAAFGVVRLADSRESSGPDEDPSGEGERRNIGEEWKKAEAKALAAAAAFDPISLELDDPRLRAAARDLHEAVYVLARLRESMHKAGLSIPEKGELVALSELASEIALGPLKDGNEAFERARALDALRNDPRVAIAGVKLAIAAEDPARALARLKRIPQANSAQEKVLEARAQLVQARKASSRAERIEAIVAAIGAGLPPGKIPVALRGEVETEAAELEDRVFAAIADMPPGAAFDSTEAPALRRRLEVLARALELWGKGTYSRELAITVADACETNAGVIPGVKAQIADREPRRLVDRGDALCEKHELAQAVPLYRAAREASGFDSFAHQRALEDEVCALVDLGQLDEADRLAKSATTEDGQHLTISAMVGSWYCAAAHWESRGKLEDMEVQERRLTVEQGIAQALDPVIARFDQDARSDPGLRATSLKAEMLVLRGRLKALLAGDDREKKLDALGDFVRALSDPRARLRHLRTATMRGSRIASTLAPAEEEVKRFERAVAFVEATPD